MLQRARVRRTPSAEARYQLAHATRRRAAVARRSLVAADLVATLLALSAVALITGSTPRPATLLLAAVIVAAGKLNRLYERDEVRLRKSTLEEVPALFQFAGMGALLLWLGDGALFHGELGRADVVLLWGVLFVMLASCRVVARYAAAHVVTVERCLIVGDRGALEEVGDKLAGRRAQVVGRVPFDELDADLETAIVESGAHRIVVVPGAHGDAEATLAVVSRAQELGTYVSILPRMFEVVGSSVDFDHVDGMTLLGVHPFGLSRSSRAVKRAIDICGSLVGLLILSPLFAVAAVAIRLDSRGGVFYRQPRVGRDGAPFMMIKFRTMVDGAHAARAELAALSHAGDGLFKVADDPRITRSGRRLRRYSLDELPQLLNVLRGDMSLVGPRPLVLEEDRQIVGRHRRRLHLTPGMTGPWQVMGTAENRVPLREMVTIDYLYAGNWSFWTDVKILVRTAIHVVRGRGL